MIMDRTATVGTMFPHAGPVAGAIRRSRPGRSSWADKRSRQTEKYPKQAENRNDQDEQYCRQPRPKRISRIRRGPDRHKQNQVRGCALFRELGRQAFGNDVLIALQRPRRVQAIAHKEDKG